MKIEIELEDLEKLKQELSTTKNAYEWASKKLIELKSEKKESDLELISQILQDHSRKLNELASQYTKIIMAFMDIKSRGWILRMFGKG